MFAPPSKSCRFSHPPSPCAKSGTQGISLSADSDLEGTCPLRESVLHLGVCRLRRQIFREMKGKTEEILCGFPSIFLKYLGKDASKMRANRCKTGSKTSPAALSWSSLMRKVHGNYFCVTVCFFLRFVGLHQKTLCHSAHQKAVQKLPKPLPHRWYLFFFADYSAPSPCNTARTVFHKILTSVFKDCSRIYRRSSSTHSSNMILLLPEHCQ